MIEKSKHEAEEAKAKLLNHTQKAEKAKKESDLASNIVYKPIHLIANHEETEDELECDYCPEEFVNKKLYKEHTQSCPICKTISKEPPYCQSTHISYSHEEMCCTNCDKYFTTLSSINNHKIHSHRCDKCDKYFKTLMKLRKHSRTCIPVQEETTDESESSN